jgi:hypothetical protein
MAVLSARLEPSRLNIRCTKNERSISSVLGNIQNHAGTAIFLLRGRVAKRSKVPDFVEKRFLDGSMIR